MAKYMIVDDNAGMRTMIRSFVCNESDSVMECSDGEAAVAAYDGFRPDYVLMDVDVKPMDGFTATERIQEQDANARIIFVSNHNTSAFQLKAKMLKAAGFVSKENLPEIRNIIQ